MKKIFFVLLASLVFAGAAATSVAGVKAYRRHARAAAAAKMEARVMDRLYKLGGVCHYAPHHEAPAAPAAYTNGFATAE